MKGKIYDKGLAILKLTIISLTLMTMTLGDYSQALAKGKKQVSVNQVMHTAFLLQKSQMVAGLKKHLQGKDFSKGSFFQGEIPELKGIAKDLKKNVKFDVLEIANGFILVTTRGKLKIGVPIEFIDPLMGRVRIAGQEIQLNKDTSYLQVAQTIASILLPPFLKQIKTKKTSLNYNPLHFLIPDAWAEEKVLRYERPKDLPGPYVKWLDRATQSFSKNDLKVSAGIIAIPTAGGGVITGTTIAKFHGAANVNISPSAAAGSAVTGAFNGYIIGLGVTR